MNTKIALIGGIALWLLSPFAMADAPTLPSPPSLGVQSYVLVGYRSGQTLASLHPERELPSGGLAKLMIGYIAFDEIGNGRLSPATEITVSKKAWRTGGSQMFLEVGDQVSVNQLLHGLITMSGNDAAVQLAQYIAGTTNTFVAYMNRYAQRLGLGHTHFANVTGLAAAGEYTSAGDIASLYAALLDQFPRLYRRYFDSKSYTYNGIRQYSHNSLLWANPKVAGGITGHDSSAGYSLAASAQRKPGGMQVIAVVLGAHSTRARKHQSDGLINYAFRFYRNADIWPHGQPIKTLRVWQGAQDWLPVVAQDAMNVTYPRGQRSALVYKATLPGRLMAPVQQGQRLGQLRVFYNERLLKEAPLYAGASIKRGRWFDRACDDLQLLLGA